MAEAVQQVATKPEAVGSPAQDTTAPSRSPSLENDIKTLLEKTPIPFHGTLVSRILEQGGFYPNPGYEGPGTELLITRPEYLLRSQELKCNSVVKAELEMFLKSGDIEYEQQSFALFCQTQAHQMFKEYEPLMSPADYQRLVNAQAQRYSETLRRNWTPLLEQCREELKNTPHTDQEQALCSLFAARAAEIFAAQGADKYQLEPQALSKRWAAVLGESEGEEKNKDPRKLALITLAKKLWEEKLTAKQKEEILKEITTLNIEMLETGLSVLRAGQLAISSTREERGMMATLSKKFFNSSEGYETLERDQGRFAAVSTRIEAAREKLTELKELSQSNPTESFNQLNTLCSKTSKDNVFFSLDEAFQEYGKFEFGPVELQTAAVTKGLLLPLGDALAKHPKTTVAVVGGATVATCAAPEVACPLLCVIAAGSFVYNGSRSLILAHEALRDSQLDLLYGSAGYAGAAAVDAAVFAGTAVASRNALLRMGQIMEADGLSLPQYFKLRLDKGIYLAKAPARWVGNKLAQLKSLDDAMIMSGQPGGLTSPGGGYGVGYTSTPMVNLEPYTMTGHFGSPEVARTVMLPGQGIVSTGAPNSLADLALQAAPYTEGLPWGMPSLGTVPVPGYRAPWTKPRGEGLFGTPGAGGAGIGGGADGVGTRGVALRVNGQPVQIAAEPVAQQTASPTGIKALLNNGETVPVNVDFNGIVVSRPGTITPGTVQRTTTVTLTPPSNVPAPPSGIPGTSTTGKGPGLAGAGIPLTLSKDSQSKDGPPEVRASNRSPDELAREITEMLRNRQFYGITTLLRSLTPEQREEILRLLHADLRREIADGLGNADRDIADMLTARHELARPRNPVHAIMPTPNWALSQDVVIEKTFQVDDFDPKTRKGENEAKIYQFLSSPDCHLTPAYQAYLFIAISAFVNEYLQEFQGSGPISSIKLELNAADFKESKITVGIPHWDSYWPWPENRPITVGKLENLFQIAGLLEGHSKASREAIPTIELVRGDPWLTWKLGYFCIVRELYPVGSVGKTHPLQVAVFSRLTLEHPTLGVSYVAPNGQAGKLFGLSLDDFALSEQEQTLFDKTRFLRELSRQRPLFNLIHRYAIDVLGAQAGHKPVGWLRSLTSKANASLYNIDQILALRDKAKLESLWVVGGPPEYDALWHRLHDETLPPDKVAEHEREIPSHWRQARDNLKAAIALIERGAKLLNYHASINRHGGLGGSTREFTVREELEKLKSLLEQGDKIMQVEEGHGSKRLEVQGQKTIDKPGQKRID